MYEIQRDQLSHKVVGRPFDTKKSQKEAFVISVISLPTGSNYTYLIAYNESHRELIEVTESTEIFH